MIHLNGTKLTCVIQTLHYYIKMRENDGGEGEGQGEEK